jgi:hypothetical protein
VQNTIFTLRKLHQTLMMGTQMVPETSVIFNQLTQLVAREDLINFGRLKTSNLKLELIFIARGPHSAAFGRSVVPFLGDGELDSPTFTKFYYTLYDNCHAWHLRNVTPVRIQSLIFCLTT